MRRAGWALLAASALLALDLGTGGADGAERTLWAGSFSGTFGDAGYQARDAALSPDGARLFVTGDGPGGPCCGQGSADWWTVAHDADSGAQLWAARDRHDSADDRAFAVAVAPDGARVFVAGQVQDGPDMGARVVAYDARDGRVAWAATTFGNGRDAVAFDLAVAPDGASVYVAGRDLRARTGCGGCAYDILAIAYDAATGAQRWLQRHNGPADQADQGQAVAVSPDGQRVLVAGTLQKDTSPDADMALVAYDAASGALQWAATLDGGAGDWARDVAVGPDGAAYVTGSSLAAAPGDWDYLVGAFDASGARRWVARYDSGLDGADRGDHAWGLALDAAGSSVFVTGTSWGGASDDIATAAFDAASGTLTWSARYDGPAGGDDRACCGNHLLAVHPRGRAVYVAGASPGVGSGDDALLLAHDAATGALLWEARHDGDGPEGGDADAARALALAPGGRSAYLAGSTRASQAGGGGGAYLALALLTNSPPVARIAAVLPAECLGGRATVALDGSLSSDPDGDPLAFAWSAEGIAFDDAAAEAPSASFPFGATAAALRVSDGLLGATTTAEVRVVDTQPPTLAIVRPEAGRVYVLDEPVLRVEGGPTAAVGALTVLAEPQDACGIAWVAFLASYGAESATTAPPWAFLADPSAALSREIRIEAMATDLGGQSASAQVRFLQAGTRSV